MSNDDNSSRNKEEDIIKRMELILLQQKEQMNALKDVQSQLKELQRCSLDAMNVQDQLRAHQEQQHAFQAEVERCLDAMSAAVTSVKRCTGAAEATKALAYMANNGTRQRISRAAVTALLDHGADPCGRLCRGMGTTPRGPALHTLVARGCVDAVRAVMEHSNEVDLTAVDEGGRTALHVLCSACPGEDDIVGDMLVSIVSRTRDPSLRTLVQWAQEERESGLDLLSCAALNGRLSLVFNEVIVEPYYGDAKDYSLSLHHSVAIREEDWQMLSLRQQKLFSVYKNRMDATDRLVSVVERCDGLLSEGDIPSLRDYVLSGADVMAWATTGDNKKKPILWYAILNGPVICVQELLRTHRPIDFTVQDKPFGWTALHCIPGVWSLQKPHRSNGEVKEILRCVMRRLSRHCNDTIQWDAQDSKGNSPLETAMLNGHASAWAEVLVEEYSVDYFAKHPKMVQHIREASATEGAKITTDERQEQ